MLEESYNEAEMKKAQVYGRHIRFRNNRESVKDNPHCWRSSTSTNEENIERVLNIIGSSR
jgi:hypothetical protein